MMPWLLIKQPLLSCPPPALPCPTAAAGLQPPPACSATRTWASFRLVTSSRRYVCVRWSHQKQQPSMPSMPYINHAHANSYSSLPIRLEGYHPKPHMPHHSHACAPTDRAPPPRPPGGQPRCQDHIARHRRHHRAHPRLHCSCHARRVGGAGHAGGLQRVRVHVAVGGAVCE